MVDLSQLGWDKDTLGEIDHRYVKPPYVRMTSYKKGYKGDIVYFYDLRITKPNSDYMTTDVLHSFEHLLLAGFRKYLGENFICVAPMGCQTGFYLVLLNEGRSEKICSVYADILKDIIDEKSVPYASPDSCGQYQHHNLNDSKKLAENLLCSRSSWLQVA